MAIELEIKAKGVDITTSIHRGYVDVELRGVEVIDLVNAIESPFLFSAISLDEYIEWADSKSKVDEILENLPPDEVITWLRDNGHLESEE